MISKALLWKEWMQTRVMLGIFLLVTVLFCSERILIDMFVFKNFLILMPLVLGLAALGRERKHNRTDWLLSMPFSRSQIIVTKTVFYLGAITTIYLINYLVILTVFYSEYDYYIYLGTSVKAITIGFGLQVLVSVAVFAFTQFMSSLFGSMLAAGIFTAIFLMLPYIFAEVLGRLSSTYYPIWLFLLSWYADQLGHLGPILALTIVLGGSALLLLASILLFRRNQMERNGELLVFSRLDLFFKAGVAALCSWIAGSIFSVFLEVALAIGAVLGWLLASQLVQRTKRHA